MNQKSTTTQQQPDRGFFGGILRSVKYSINQILILLKMKMFFEYESKPMQKNMVPEVHEIESKLLFNKLPLILKFHYTNI